MNEVSGELTAILTIVWWLQTLGKDCQWVTNQNKFWWGKI